jgi:hypothetical protein
VNLAAAIFMIAAAFCCLLVVPASFVTKKNGGAKGVYCHSAFSRHSELAKNLGTEVSHTDHAVILSGVLARNRRIWQLVLQRLFIRALVLTPARCFDYATAYASLLRATAIAGGQHDGLTNFRRKALPP